MPLGVGPSNVATAPSSYVDGYAVETNSSNAILVTSGAHTIYITDLMFSADIATSIKFFSAATTKGEVYLATKGGFVLALNSPLQLNSAQSLTFTPSVSGSVAGFAVGYTVT